MEKANISDLEELEGAGGGLMPSPGGDLLDDDSHGLGVLGRRVADARCPFGRGGGGLLRFAGAAPPRVIVAGTLTKALGAPLAFVAGDTGILRRVAAASQSFVHSSPPSIANVAAAHAALLVQHDRGDGLRDRLAQLAERFRAGATRAGVDLASNGLFPIQTVRLSSQDAEAVMRMLIRAGVWPALQHRPPDAPRGSVLRFFPWTHLQNSADLFVGKAVGHESYDLALARTEAEAVQLNLAHVCREILCDSDDFWRRRCIHDAVVNQLRTDEGCRRVQYMHQSTTPAEIGSRGSAPNGAGQFVDSSALVARSKMTLVAHDCDTRTPHIHFLTRRPVFRELRNGCRFWSAVVHRFVRSRSNSRSVTVQLSGTDCGVKHTLSSHAW